MMELYDLQGYGAMIADRVRIDAYHEALRRTVTADSVVVDLGTGAVGILALLAWRLGARRVVAVESVPVIGLARRIAADNDAAGIEFVEGASRTLELAEPADVVVSDLRGVLPPFRDHLATVIDVRERLLSPTGTLIPARDRLMASLVEAPEAYAPAVRPWAGAPAGLDLGEARRRASQAWWRAVLPTGCTLTAPACWSTLDYGRLASRRVEGDIDTTVERPGTAHGVAAWFEAELTPGVSFSTGPEAPRTLYGQAFFPLPEAVEVAAGDRAGIRLRADPVGDDHVWRWETRLEPGPAAGDGRRPVRFEQSTFLGWPVSRDGLRRREEGHRPEVGLDGRIDAFLLARMDGTATLAGLADALLAAFPGAFAGRPEALARAADVAARYPG